MSSPVAEAPPRREPLLDTDQAAKAIGIARHTLAIWRIKGFGPEYFKMGKKILYDPAVLHRWMEANRRTSTSDRSSS